MKSDERTNWAYVLTSAITDHLSVRTASDANRIALEYGWSRLIKDGDSLRNSSRYKVAEKSQAVCVIGLGYIGLPTASLLATKGFDVYGVDVRPRVIETINCGEIHIHEPDLDVLVKSAVRSGKLRAGLEPIAADVFIIAVPTPIRNDKTPELIYVDQAADAIAPLLSKGSLVILESTSPVGTTERVAERLRRARPDLVIPKRRAERDWEPSPAAISSSDGTSDIYLAHCPERVLPGQILKELVENDRIVGGIDKESADAAASFYAAFTNGQIHRTDSRTAELTKLSENAFRDVNIAFANELSMICEKLEIDVWQLIAHANRHPRVNILRPGPGVGGHCIAVDPWFIVDAAKEDADLIRAAREVNDRKPRFVYEQALRAVEGIDAPKIAALGLAFKADIDDLRESPSLDIVKMLAENERMTVIAVEPHVQELPSSLSPYAPRVMLAGLEEAIGEADLVLLLTDHREFIGVERSLLKGKKIIDTRGVWE